MLASSPYWFAKPEIGLNKRLWQRNNSCSSNYKAVCAASNTLICIKVMGLSHRCSHPMHREWGVMEWPRSAFGGAGPVVRLLNRKLMMVLYCMWLSAVSANTFGLFTAGRTACPWYSFPTHACVLCQPHLVFVWIDQAAATACPVHFPFCLPSSTAASILSLCDYFLLGGADSE